MKYRRSLLSIALSLVMVFAFSISVNATDSKAGSTKKSTTNKNVTSKSTTNKSTTTKKNVMEYTTNDKTTYKNGNSGVYSYKSRGKNYDVYYIIDFDDGVVYDFTDGNGEETCTKAYIKSGDLNSTLVVTYYDGDDSWESGLYFKYKKQPDHLCFQLEAGYPFILDLYTTDLEEALKLRDTKNITDHKW